MNGEPKTDEEYIKAIRDNLRALIVYCTASKTKIQDMGGWEVVHDTEFQLELAFESLRRYLAKIEEGRIEDGE